MSDDVLRSADEVEACLSEGSLDGRLVQEIDLSGVSLDNRKLADVRFRRVGTHGTHAASTDWSRVRFSESSMRGAGFSGGRMRGCTFFSSELIEARFDHTTLTSTEFFGCGLSNVNFEAARLQSVTFSGCELFAAKLGRTLMMNTRFVSGEREDVPLDRADLSHAILVDCDLQGANLYAANFDHTLLVKVDLRHTNLAGATFEGARFIDVSVDTSLLDPEQARAIEAARIEDPWRDPSLLSGVLAMHGEAELAGLVDALIRTYVIEGGQATAPMDSFASVLSQLYSLYDFPELDHLRATGALIEARSGGRWQPLGGPAEAVASPEPVPAPPAESQAETEPGPPPPEAVTPSPRAAGAEAEARPEAPSKTPKNVGTSKRFRRLEID